MPNAKSNAHMDDAGETWLIEIRRDMGTYGTLEYSGSIIRI